MMRLRKRTGRLRVLVRILIPPVQFSLGKALHCKYGQTKFNLDIEAWSGVKWLRQSIFETCCSYRRIRNSSIKDCLYFKSHKVSGCAAYATLYSL